MPILHLKHQFFMTLAPAPDIFHNRDVAAINLKILETKVKIIIQRFLCKLKTRQSIWRVYFKQSLACFKR